MININTRRCLSLIIISQIVFFSACDKKPKQEFHPVSPQENTESVSLSAEKPLADFQAKLLDVAYLSAAAIPLNPHIKDRSRAQICIVEVCLKLGQPNLALGYIEGIENWRRGAGYADLAMYYARCRDNQKAETFLAKANQIAEEGMLQETSSGREDQEWRSDHIRAKIAQTYTMLGKLSDAGQFEADLNESEIGKTAIIRAEISDASTFDQQIADMNELAQQKHLETVKNAVNAYSELFDRFYADFQKRRQVEQKVLESSRKLPAVFGIHTYRDMATSAIEHGDPNKAIELLDAAERMIEGHRWDLEDLIPNAVNLLKVRFQAGQAEKVKSAADALWQKYNQDRHKIVNIFRAGAIRPLAELYQLMGDSAMALKVYKQALQEGIENPNSRPRAEDLSATLCSMAQSGFEPDTEVWTLIYTIHQGLGQPW